MSEARRRTILGIIATDSSFERVEHRGREVWLGKCIHCNGNLLVALSGEPISRATVEHLVPRGQGGTDAPENLALACARCNHQKGRTHDLRYATDPRVQEMVEKLLRRRQARWREPEE